MEEEQKEEGTVLINLNVTVEKVVEGQEVDCAGDIQEFTTTVFADASTDLGELAAEQKALLEQTFKNAYNGLTFAVCDGLFRSVQSVNLQTAAVGRRLQEETIDNGLYNSTSGNSTFGNLTFSNTSTPYSYDFSEGDTKPPVADRAAAFSGKFKN